MKKGTWIRRFFLGFLGTFSSLGFSGDAGDIYAYGLYGRQLRTGLNQASVGAGYCFWDSWGLAPVYDYTKKTYSLSLEGRYFFEPFETAIALGMLSRRDALQNIIYRPLFTGSASYLFAITPSLALKFESKGQFIWKDKGNMYLGGGLRFLY